jgi:hypothetical protein
VHTYNPSSSANSNSLKSLVFSFPVDDTVATIHSFSASFLDKVLVGNVVDKEDVEQSNINDNEKGFVPTVNLSKERDRFEVF